MRTLRNEHYESPYLERMLEGEQVRQVRNASYVLCRGQGQGAWQQRADREAVESSVKNNEQRWLDFLCADARRAPERVPTRRSIPSGKGSMPLLAGPVVWMRLLLGVFINVMVNVREARADHI